MLIADLIETAEKVNQFRGEVNNISARSGGAEVLLHPQTFLELFQTYEQEKIASGKILTAKICGVEFRCVIHDDEDY